MKARYLALVLLAVLIAAMIPDTVLPMPASDVWADARMAPGARQNAGPIGTAFTYQGQLTRGGQPYTGNCFFEFALFREELSGTQVGSTLTDIPVPVTDGLFTVDLDFGAAPFGIDERWLQIGVMCPYETGYTYLQPRQRLAPVPNSIYSASSDTVDGLHASDFMAAQTDDWVDTGGDTMTGWLIFNRAAPIISFRENDQALPGGLWRIAVDGGDWRVDQNTAPAGDFSTTIKPLFIQDGGYVGINTMTPERQFDVNGDALVHGQVKLRSSTPWLSLDDTTSVDDNYSVYVNNGNLYFWWDRGDDSVWDSPNPLVLDGLDAQFGQDASVARDLTVGRHLAVSNDVTVSDDVTVTDSLTVNGPALEFFPRPEYDSGWFSIDEGTQVTLTYDLSGMLNYFADMQCRGASGGSNRGIGDDVHGTYYYNLTSTGVTIARMSLDGWCPFVRFRIWVID